MAILVLALLLVLGSGRESYEEARIARVEMRELRVALLNFTRAQHTARTAGAQHVADRDEASLAAFEAARAAARSSAADALRLSAFEVSSRAAAERLAATTERLFLNLEEAMRQDAPRRRNDLLTAAMAESLERDTAALHEAILRRSEAVNLSETAARNRTDFLSGVLALLSLIVAALAGLALHRERTQWRLATEAAEDARAKAAASDLAKTRFLAVASHDMRQPLHALTLYLSALERRVDSDEARDILAKMDRATQSMVGMFAMLLDLARIQAGVVEPAIEVVRLQDAFDRVVAQYPDSVVEVAPTPLCVRTDPVLLDRILQNLVSNAVRHGGGKARISVAPQGNADIVIADDGPGIAVEDHERIFEEFVRVEGRADGLGLGLAIVKRIADLLKMPIRVESAPGAGARFIVTAPLAETVDAQTIAAPPIEAIIGLKVLVVDDEVLAREAVSRALRDVGANVRMAANEAEAAAVLTEFKPALLVMDLRVEGQLQGIDIARRLSRAVEPAPKTIVVTGDTAADTLTLLRESGFPWLIKPVDREQLIRAVAKELAG
ncbi:MAG: hypothetical protein DCF16_15560 [Alphaproteobacteria bacterium]|nr:MAG: hypothetical protein DCF16_15560 [Alphaproteobacteria bacterium]